MTNAIRFYFATLDNAPVGPLRWLVFCLIYRPTALVYRGKHYEAHH